VIKESGARTRTHGLSEGLCPTAPNLVLMVVGGGGADLKILWFCATPTTPGLEAHASLPESLTSSPPQPPLFNSPTLLSFNPPASSNLKSLLPIHHSPSLLNKLDFPRHRKPSPTPAPPPAHYTPSKPATNQTTPLSTRSNPPPRSPPPPPPPSNPASTSLPDSSPTFRRPGARAPGQARPRGFGLMCRRRGRARIRIWVPAMGMDMGMGRGGGARARDLGSEGFLSFGSRAKPWCEEIYTPGALGIIVIPRITIKVRGSKNISVIFSHWEPSIPS